MAEVNRVSDFCYVNGMPKPKRVKFEVKQDDLEVEENVQYGMDVMEKNFQENIRNR